MSAIYNNMSALVGYNNLIRNEKIQKTSSERISSGKRINHASDNAAKLSISEKMRAQIKGLDMANKNVKDTKGMLDNASSAYTEIIDLSQRFRELSVQSSSTVYTEEDRKK